MKVIYSDDHRLHVPYYESGDRAGGSHPEVPERANIIVQTLGEHGRYSITPPVPHDLDRIDRVHSPAYREFLERLCSELDPHEIFIPAGLTSNPDILKGDHLKEMCGYYAFGQDTPLCRGTYRAAIASVNAALTGADALRAGDSAVYALCRPPGHHAEKEKLGGFCYFNNCVIAAEELVKEGKVLILDVDFHHGNGTQHLTYHRDDIVYISIHGDPSFTYPSISGWEEEKGEGKGLNCNINHPLPPGTDGNTYLEIVDRVAEEILACKPVFMVISIGFDTYRDDPISHFRLEKEDIHLTAKKLAALKIPTLIVQEGGYCLQELGNLAIAFLSPFTRF